MGCKRYNCKLYVSILVATRVFLQCRQWVVTLAAATDCGRLRHGSIKHPGDGTENQQLSELGE